MAEPVVSPSSTIQQDSTTNLPTPQKQTDGAAWTADRGIAANLAIKHITDLTTTRQKLLFPSGAVWMALQYRLETGETATANQWARVVLNAVSDADADGKLATADAHIQLFQGDDLYLTASNDSPITRVDVASIAAVGTEETRFQVLAGVL
jgi:hypothetical protein